MFEGARDAQIRVSAREAIDARKEGAVAVDGFARNSHTTEGHRNTNRRRIKSAETNSAARTRWAVRLEGPSGSCGDSSHSHSDNGIMWAHPRNRGDQQHRPDSGGKLHYDAVNWNGECNEATQESREEELRTHQHVGWVAAFCVRGEGRCVAVVGGCGHENKLVAVHSWPLRIMGLAVAISTEVQLGDQVRRSFESQIAGGLATARGHFISSNSFLEHRPRLSISERSVVGLSYFLFPCLAVFGVWQQYGNDDLERNSEAATNVLEVSIMTQEGQMPTEGPEGPEGPMVRRS
ncbi:hypothetical protein FB451DRAFT_1179789 [Mycena latifolia]|nr:hypothetical protein FB451DRAFT_1179789 [Mycena latifolia]